MVTGLQCKRGLKDEDIA